MPKPKYLSLDYVRNNAVSVKYYEIAHFDNPLHYHKELELYYRRVWNTLCWKQY